MSEWIKPTQLKKKYLMSRVTINFDRKDLMKIGNTNYLLTIYAIISRIIILG